MSGDRTIFEQATQQGRIAAQRGDWLTALQAARQAIGEMPDDPGAKTSLAVALYHNAQYAEAVQKFEELRKHRPDDLSILMYLARAYMEVGNTAQAVDVLIGLGEQSIKQRLLTDALDAFEEAVRLSPKNHELRIRLAEILLELDEPIRAAEQCIEIGRIHLAAGNYAGAIEAIDEALSLDPANRTAYLIKAELDRLPKLDASVETPPTDVPEQLSVTGALSDPQFVVEQLVVQANAYQQAGDGAAALRLFQQAVNYGSQRADVLYGLGILYQEKNEHQQALDLLRKAALDEEYQLSSHYAIGNSLRATGDLRAAVEEYETMLRLVDLDTVERGEADDLYAMYRAAAETHAQLGNLSRAASLYGTLADVFQSKRWGKDVAAECRSHAAEFTARSMSAKLHTLGTGKLPVEMGINELPPPASAVEQALPSWSGSVLNTSIPSEQTNVDPFAAWDALLPMEQVFLPVTPLDCSGCEDVVVRLIDASGRFIEQGFVWAAIDTCHEVIHHDPNYLPVHLRLGEIYERSGHIEDALSKYRTLIDTYIARGQELEAIDAYYRVVELSPEAIDMRARLVSVLRKANRTEEAVEQALVVANTYFRLGQTSHALEEFRRIQRWSPPSSRLHKEYGQALLKLERWEAAQAEFRRAVRLDSADPVALAQLNLTMAVLGQDERILWESFAALFEKLRAEPHHQPAVQAEYRAALLVSDVPILHYLLGLLQQLAGQHALALLAFEQAFALVGMQEHRELPPLLLHQAMSDSYLALGQAQHALEQLQMVQRLLREEPQATISSHPFTRPFTDFELQHRFAEIFAYLGRPMAAIEAFEKCLQSNANVPEVWAKLAQLYAEQGDKASAAKHYLKLSKLYERQHRLDRSIEVLRQASDATPGNLEVQSRLAYLLLQSGLTDQSLTTYETVATLYRQENQSDQATLLLQEAAELFWMVGRYDMVKHLFSIILSWSPDHLQARQQLIHFHILAGDQAAALAELQQMKRICNEQQLESELLNCLQQIIALDPDDLEAQQCLHELQMQQQDYAGVPPMY
jgi:tetratricopeptide (TPR) repeat protein